MSRTFLFLTSVVILLSAIDGVEGMRKQGISLKGRLLCGSQPASTNTTKVRIVDVDTGPDPDDTLDENFVGLRGEFQLNGYTRELTDIDPVVYIWTDCNDGHTPCHRRIKMTIPKKFIINEEPKATDWVDMGTVNLQSIFEDEQRECIF
jgi:hypothetical protein